MRWMVRGDIDGFLGLALDNRPQFLLIDARDDDRAGQNHTPPAP